MKTEEFKPTKFQTQETFVALGGSRFFDLEPAQRVATLQTNIDQTRQIALPETIVTPETWKRLGVIVVKPEAYEFREVIQNFLLKQGIQLLHTQTVQYTPEQLWNVYGEVFVEYAQTIGLLLPGLFLNHTNGTSYVITFAHKSADQYRKMFENKQQLSAIPFVEGDTQTNDPQHTFKRLFVGTGSHPAPGSIRSFLQEMLIRKGADTLTRSVMQAFDPTGELRVNSRAGNDNLRTFNGIHSPATTEEVIKFVHQIFPTKTLQKIDVGLTKATQTAV